MFGTPKPNGKEKEKKFFDLFYRALKDRDAREGVMAYKEIKIELALDLRDDDSEAALIEAAKDASRTLLTVAMMLAEGRRKPTVKLSQTDLLHGKKELEIEDV